ncbi:5331_t:CDS:2 [Dentiscutata erythropus]|uniref:5331_t:CDS:1 n=1 Tax=Dentiscutata erythropus TaxID=1348616 RepID=A0A9N8Z5R2_9GLOM|nr:5331_t:CDS:2 [Dentiscutata erythropus]
MDPSSYSFHQSPLMSPNTQSLPNSPPNSLMPPNSPPYPTSPNSPPKSPLLPPNLPPKSPLLPPRSPYMSPNLPQKSPYMPPNLSHKSPYMPPSLPSKSPYTSPTLSPSNSISYSMSPQMPPNSTYSKSPVMSPNTYVKSDTSPLTLLIETEEEYLRVTASWNGDNPPPKKLDNMFCLVDKVYRQNRELFHKLKKIKQDPQSAESLVDVLVNWIDRMEKPYTSYCQGYIRGIESLPEIEGNIALQQTLNRQLRNSEPGSSENMHFTNAIKRIDLLIDIEKRARSSQDSNNELPISPTNQPSTPPDNYIVDADYSDSPESPHQVKNVWTLPELEVSLDTTRTVDFVTKKPKQIKIDFLPPRLPFNREIILNADFTVYEDDESDSSIRAHIFLLTDLLLVCQRLSPDEKQINPNKEFYLLHPPFSGRYLSINDNLVGNEESIQLNFMQKKDLVILTEDREQRKRWIQEIYRMINFTVQAAANSRHSGSNSPNMHGPNSPNMHGSNSPNMHGPNSPNMHGPNSPNMHGPNSPNMRSSQNMSNSRLSAPQNPQSPPFSSAQTPQIKKSLSTGNLPTVNRPQPPTGHHMSHPNYGPNELNMTQYERFPRTASMRSQDELNVPQYERFPRTTSMRSQERLREVEQTVTRLIEAKCKVFLQKDHGVWKNFGWGDMTLDLESPSRKKRIIIDIDKPKVSRFVDAIVSESGVQKTGKCKVAITVPNNNSPVPSIYMMQMKDDNIANKVYEYIRRS